MQINFLVNEVAGGWEPTDKFLAGTEDSVVSWAEELVKRGHTVTVWHNATHNEYALYEGVHYLPRDRYVTESTDADICINVKSSNIPPKEPTLYLTNEFNASDLDLSAYAGVIWPSQWAVDNIPVNNQTFILPHGYDPEEIYAARKVSKQCFYASSPDRGLQTLIDIWPHVMEAHPDASLILTYGAPKTNLPGIINLGEVDEETMNQVYQTSDIWCHPCSGGELYCMTGKKAQVAGCIPVIVPRGALKETVKTGFMAKDESEYLALLLHVLAKPEEDRNLLRQDIIENAHAFSWTESTDILERIIDSVIE